VTSGGSKKGGEMVTLNEEKIIRVVIILGLAICGSMAIWALINYL